MTKRGPVRRSGIDLLLQRLGSKSAAVSLRAYERIEKDLGESIARAEDAVRVNAALAQYLIDRDREKARHFAGRATEAAETVLAVGPDAAFAFRVSALANWLDDPATSLSHCRKALDLLEEINEPEGLPLAEILNLLGLRLQSFDDNRAALAHYERAREIAERIGARHLTRQIVRRMSNTRQDMGQFAEATDLLAGAEPMAGAPPSERLSWQHSMALLHERRNQPWLAERRYDRSIRLFEKYGAALSYQLAALTNAGQLKADLGRVVQAEYCLALAEKLEPALQGDAYRASRARLTAKIAFQKGGVDAALVAIGAALGDMSDNDTAQHSRQALVLIAAEMLAGAGRARDAVLWLREQLDISVLAERLLLDHEAHGAMLLVILSLACGEPVPEWVVSQCLPLISTTEEPQMEAMVLAATAEIHATKGRIEEAVAIGKLAARGASGSSFLHASRTFQPATLNIVRGAVFGRLQSRLVNLGRLAEKRQIEGALRRQAITDISGDDSAESAIATSIPMTPLEQDLASRYEAFTAQLRADACRLSAPGADKAAFDAAYRRLEQDAAVFAQMLLLGNPDFDAPRPRVPLAPVFRDAKAGRNALLIQFHVGQSETIIEHRLHGVDGLTRVPVGAQRLHHDVDAIVSEMLAGRNVLDIATRIYAGIMAPLRPLLQQSTVIDLVVDGPLWNLPFAALHDGERFLVETHAIQFRTGSAPRASSPWTVPEEIFAFGLQNGHSGLPDLPHVKSELAGIKSHFRGASRYSNGRFSKARLIKALETRPHVIHIASHFEAAPGGASAARLLIGGERAIPLAELAGPAFKWDSIPLVVLSACDTASVGSGGAALAGMLQTRGVQWVVASLSPVRDKLSAGLATALYAGLAKGMDPAAALRNAQIALLSGGAENSDWSSFRAFCPSS